MNQRTRHLLFISNLLFVMSVFVVVGGISIYALTGIEKSLLLTALCPACVIAAIVIRRFSDPAYDYAARGTEDDPAGGREL